MITEQQGMVSENKITTIQKVPYHVSKTKSCYRRMLLHQRLRTEAQQHTRTRHLSI